jgi:hypothetical protein
MLSPLKENKCRSSLSIFSANGAALARFFNIKSNRVFWSPSDENLPQGLYILKAELPDRSAVTRTLMFTR